MKKLLIVLWLFAATAFGAERAQQIEFLLSQVRADGVALSGGTATFFYAGTSNLKNIWLDRNKTSIAANPYTLDANATAQLFGDGLYKVVIKNSAGVVKYTRDNMYFKSVDRLGVDISDYSDLTAAVIAIGNITPTKLIINTPTIITGDTTVPSNIQIEVTKTGSINQGVYTLTMPVPEAGRYQIFTGTGAVTFSSSGAVYPEWWGAKGDGATDDTTAFSSAATTTSNSGAVLIGADGAIYRLTGSVVVSGGLRMRGGTIKQGKDHEGIVVEPPRTTTTTVTATSTVTYPASTGILYTTQLTVSSATGFARNDICMIRSADTYTFDNTIKKAELVKINEISGTTIYLGGMLKESYSTNIELIKLNPATVDIEGVTFTYDGDPLIPTSKTRTASLILIGCVAPKIKATFKKDLADGLRMFSCWQPNIDIVASDLRNNATYGMLGYAVAAYGACRAGKIRVIADNVRHAYTDGTWLNTILPIRDGRVQDMTIYDSIAMNTTYASFDTHPGAVNTSFINCLALHNMTNSDQGSRNNSYAYQDRGLNTKFINCRAKNVNSVFYFGSVLTDYGEKNITEVHGGYAETELTSQGQAFNGLPTKTSLDVCEINIKGFTMRGYLPIQNAQTEQVLSFYDSRIIGNNSYGLAFTNNNGPMRFFSTSFEDLTTMRFGQNNTTSLIGCRRINSGSNVEPIVIDVGSTATINDYYAEAGSYGNSRIIQAGLGANAGVVTLNLGRIAAKGFTANNPVATNGTATVTINMMEQRQIAARKGTTANRPILGANDIGFIYLDTTLDPDGKPVWWNGTVWVDATGTGV